MGAAHGCFIYLTKLHLKVSQSLLTQEVLRCEWYRVRYWMGRQPYRGEGSGESWAVPGGVWDSFAFFS